MLGHVGGPLGYGPYAGKRDEVFRSWKARLTELARCENVNLKLGGMMMRLAAFDYRTAPRPPSSAELAALWRPYIETGIELFGPSRCLVGEQLSRRQDGNRLGRVLERAQADHRRRLAGGEAGDVQRDRAARLPPRVTARRAPTRSRA